MQMEHEGSELYKKVREDSIRTIAEDIVSVI